MAQLAARPAGAHTTSARSRSTTASAASGIGEASVVIAVSAPHRAGRARRLQGRDRPLKETVPLWKKEVYEGGEEWIGRGS